jgi:hypothetical protein
MTSVDLFEGQVPNFLFAGRNSVYFPAMHVAMGAGMKILANRGLLAKKQTRSLRALPL